MSVSGGLRARLIKESFWRMLESSLTSLGWMQGGRSHAPIILAKDVVPDSDPILPNTLSVIDLDNTPEVLELGTNAKDVRWPFCVDFYGENDAISIQMSYDVRDILLGRMPSIGRSGPTLEVRDWTKPNNPILFIAAIEDVFVDRPERITQSWQRHFRSVFCELEYIDAAI